MVYRALGVMYSHSGISIAFAEFRENAGTWIFETRIHKVYDLGTINPVRRFIDDHDLQYHVALITLHSEVQVTPNNGASVAASTGLPVITDLPGLDFELGGNGQFYSSIAKKLGIEDTDLDDLQKALCVAFMGILRWREEYNFLSSITGATRNSIGGAVWLGQEA